METATTTGPLTVARLARALTYLVYGFREAPLRRGSAEHGTRSPVTAVPPQAEPELAERARAPSGTVTGGTRVVPLPGTLACVVFDQFSEQAVELSAVGG